MPERVPFIHKLLKNLDRVDRAVLQSTVKDLAEEAAIYEALLHELNEGVMRVSQEGRIRYVNRQAGIWLGLDEGGPVKSRVLHSIQDAAVESWIQDHLATRSKIVEDLSLLVPREMDLRIAMIPLDNANLDVLILLLNIGQEKSRERESERLAQTEALVSLAAGVAHEIGNPLNSLAIHLELLKKEVKNVPLAKRKAFDRTLSVLNSETSRLDKIIKNFLKATRRPPLRFQTESLNELVEEALGFLEPELKSHKIVIYFRPDRNLPPFLLDRERMHQVFINLIKNAMEAMPKGGALRITSSHRDRIAFLRFQDEGGGIPEEHLPHIFEAYYTTKEEGSGLGLMMVLTAIREHGGRIEVQSKAGKGTTFTLLLPIRQPKLQLTQETKATTAEKK